MKYQVAGLGQCTIDYLGMVELAGLSDYLITSEKFAESVIVQHPLTLTLSHQGRGNSSGVGDVSSPLVMIFTHT